MRQHHRGKRTRAARGETYLPVDIFLSGLYQALQTAVDLLAYRRGHPRGHGEPQGGSGYDSLYAAADSRAKADWLVGMNASRALATASGSANNSIGRVQTPTLAMICARFKENRNFVSTPYWQLHIALKKDDVHRQFFHPEDFRDKNGAEAAYRRITSDSVVTIIR